VSVSYFVRYDIAVPDLKEFLERYRKAHVPLVTSWPGLRRMVLHTPVDWKDPFPANRGRQRRGTASSAS
jgi:mRNA-degrading endonuclease HigB of HigAB toxin-antitoxin module